MLDEPGCVMERAGNAYDDAGVMVAFGACGPLVVEEFDGDEEREPPEDDVGEGRGWRFWRKIAARGAG